MDQYEHICSVVERVTGYRPKEAGHNRRKGMCPAHADEKPSFTLTKDEKAGLIGQHCFAGCSFQDVLEALELEPRDFRLRGGGGRSRPKSTIRHEGRAETTPATRRESSRKGEPEGKEVERYPYRDEDGTVLYYNIRFEPKDFRLADKNGKRANLPKNMKWVPYELPELIAGIEQGRTVYWVEGERDVHSLKARGEVATTNAGGSSRPLDPEWVQYFEGANVVVVCDKDKPGRAYGRAVARLLVNTVDSIRIAESATPQKKSDVTDHLTAGYQLGQLAEVPMRSVRRTRWTLSAIMDTPPEPLRWVLPGVIPEGLTLLVGAPKVGKSWWNINMMAALGSGDPHSVFNWGQMIDPTPNLYLALEDPQRRIYSRMRQVTRGIRFNPALAGDVWLDLDPIEKGGKEEIEKWLDVHPQARVVMVDVLAKVRGGGDESAGMYQADYAAVSILKEIADDYGVGVIVTHHDRKKTDEDFLNMVSGTKGVTGAADTILYLTRDRGSTEGLLRVESRDVEECQYKMEFQRDTGRWRIMDKEDLGADPDKPTVVLLDEIERLIMANGNAKVGFLAEVLKRNPQEILSECKKGEERGSLVKTRDGSWHVSKG